MCLLNKKYCLSVYVKKTCEIVCGQNKLATFSYIGNKGIMLFDALDL